MKAFIQRLAWQAGYTLRKRVAVPADIPDRVLYDPFFQPWQSPEFQRTYRAIRGYSLVSPEAAYVLWASARQAARLSGEWWECGVYRGGTAMLLADVLPPVGRLRLFDTFAGMPLTDPERDKHRAGDFADTSAAAVAQRVGHAHQVTLHAGLIPQTFAGLESSSIALAHVDVDIYSSVEACCQFIYPRLIPGGVLLFDDYGAPTCPGARAAVDTFFANKPETPLALASGQAIVHKLPL